MASARDIIILGVVIWIIGMGFFMSYKTLNDTYTKILGTSQINESPQAVEAIQGGIDVTNRMDYVVFGVFIGLVLGILITGWFLAGHPLFVFVYFLVIVIGVVLSVVMANVWETATLSTVFGSTITHFPITNNLIINMPIYMAIVGFLGMIVVFAKPGLTGGGDEFY